MIDVLRYCNEQLKTLPCCHAKGNDCNCYNCLREGFYIKRDDYICFKKLCYYVINYGPSFASEIYHYLAKSKIIDEFIAKNKSELKIVSLGCGFGPDMYAIEKYISDNSLPISISYLGYDVVELWEKIRNPLDFAKFENKDLLKGFDLSSYDIVIINKLYSTLYRNGLSKPFIKILNEQVVNNLPAQSYVVYIDILGDAKNEFANGITGIFSSAQYYYFRNGTYNHKFRSTKIDEIDNVFEIPEDLKITPKRDVNKTIVFAYRK